MAKQRGEVRMHLPFMALGEEHTECVLAESLGGSRFRITNIPFVHDEVRFMDVVEAVPDLEHPNTFRLVRVVEPKGNGSMLFHYRTPETFDRCGAIARRHGASLEGGHPPSGGDPGLAVMSVPPEAWQAIEAWFNEEIDRGAITIITHAKPITRSS